jgi:hypothetical protein
MVTPVELRLKPEDSVDFFQVLTAEADMLGASSNPIPRRAKRRGSGRLNFSAVAAPARQGHERTREDAMKAFRWAWDSRPPT